MVVDKFRLVAFSFVGTIVICVLYVPLAILRRGVKIGVLFDVVDVVLYLPLVFFVGGCYPFVMNEGFGWLLACWVVRLSLF